MDVSETFHCTWIPHSAIVSRIIDTAIRLRVALGPRMVRSRRGSRFWPESGFIFAGLKVTAYLNPADYLQVTEAAGVRLIVHDHDEYPFPDTFGYNAPPGQLTSFGLQMVSVLETKLSSRSHFHESVFRNVSEDWNHRMETASWTMKAKGAITCIRTILIRRKWVISHMITYRKSRDSLITITPLGMLQKLSTELRHRRMRLRRS